MKKILILAAVLSPTAAWAQSTPNLAPMQIPTAEDWNGYFAAKADVAIVLGLAVLGVAAVLYLLRRIRKLEERFPAR